MTEKSGKKNGKKNGKARKNGKAKAEAEKKREEAEAAKKRAGAKRVRTVKKLTEFFVLEAEHRTIKWYAKSEFFDFQAAPHNAKSIDVRVFVDRWPTTKEWHKIEDLANASRQIRTMVVRWNTCGHEEMQRWEFVLDHEKWIDVDLGVDRVMRWGYKAAKPAWWMGQPDNVEPPKTQMVEGLVGGLGPARAQIGELGDHGHNSVRQMTRVDHGFKGF